MGGRKRSSCPSSFIIVHYDIIISGKLVKIYHSFTRHVQSSVNSLKLLVCDVFESIELFKCSEES